MMVMTTAEEIDEIKQRVEEIRVMARDPLEAHILEDQLMRDVLELIAVGAPDAAKLAMEALRSGEIEFARHCV